MHSARFDFMARIACFAVWALILSQPVAPAQTPVPVTAAHKDHGAPSKVSIAGIWEGPLDAGVMKLRLLFKIKENPDGSLSATMDSPDQGAKDIPFNLATLKDNKIRLELNGAAAAFDGELNSFGNEMTGQWQQGGASLPLTMKRTEKPAELLRPQVPKKPYPYDEIEVVYDNTQGKVRLAGTLTVPRGTPPYPAVLLITGSGPQDRDETVFGHKPFLVLADYLTRRGIAVLRVDDRGVGASTGEFAKATCDDFAGDVLSGLAFLQGRKEINLKHIGLIGHSEGGMIAPMVATRSKGVAFIVMLAGLGVTGEQILCRQVGDIARAIGLSPEVIEKQRAYQAALYSIIKKENDPAVREKRVREVVAKKIAELGKDQEKLLNAQPGVVEGEVRSNLSPWLCFFLTYDPRPVLEKVHCPVLALNGEKDLNVAADINLPAIEQAFKAGGNRDVTLVKLPGLNHLFQTCQSGLPVEYGQIEETFSPKALNIIGDWIIKHTQEKK